MTGLLLWENHFPSGRWEAVGVQVNSTVLGVLVMNCHILRRSSKGKRGKRVKESGEGSGMRSFAETQNWQ